MCVHGAAASVTVLINTVSSVTFVLAVIKGSYQNGVFVPGVTDRDLSRRKRHIRRVFATKGVVNTAMAS